MMKYTDEKIQAFLEGDLDQVEKEEFLQALQQDVELQGRVKFFEEMDQFLNENDWAISTSERKSSRVQNYQSFLEGVEGKSHFKTIENASNSYFETDNKSDNEGKQVFGWFGKLSIAASVLLLAALATFFFLKSPDSTELYLAYKDSSPLPSLVNRNEASPLNDFNTWFDAGENLKALQVIEDYIRVEGAAVNPQLYLYKGEILLRLDRIDDALATYTILEKGGTLDASKAYWYKSMAYLKADKPDMAANELEKLIGSGSKFNQNEAKELLDRLK